MYPLLHYARCAVTPPAPSASTRLAPPPSYRGGNCELGAGATRLAVGAFAVNPMTAQLMSTPAAPYGAPLGPVNRSGRVAARLKTTFSSICRLSSPAAMAFGVHWPSSASHNGL